jgi:hypothetical protein
VLIDFVERCQGDELHGLLVVHEAECVLVKAVFLYDFEEG